MRKTRFLQKVKKITGISLGRNERVLTNSRGNPISQEMHSSLADLQRTSGQKGAVPKVRYRIDLKSGIPVSEQLAKQGAPPEVVERRKMDELVKSGKLKRAQ